MAFEKCLTFRPPFSLCIEKKIIKRDACRLRSSFLANLQRGVGTSQHKMSSWQQHTPRSLMRPLYYTLQRLGWGHHNFPKAGNHALILRTLMTKVRAHLFWQSGIYIHEFYVFIHYMVFIECVAPRIFFVQFSRHFANYSSASHGTRVNDRVNY